MQTIHKYFQMFKEINAITSNKRKPKTIGGMTNEIKAKTRINYF